MWILPRGWYYVAISAEEESSDEGAPQRYGLVFVAGQLVATYWFDNATKGVVIANTNDYDRWLCANLRTGPCSSESPCLWDVESDVGEHHEVAAENPGVVAQMVARLGVLSAQFQPNLPLQGSNDDFCAHVKARGGFLGPSGLDNSSLERVVSALEQRLAPSITRAIAVELDARGGHAHGKRRMAGANQENAGNSQHSHPKRRSSQAVG